MKEARLDIGVIKDRAIFNNGHLAFINNLQDISVKDAVKTGIYLFVLITQGNAKVTINGATYELEKNDLFIGMPNKVIEGSIFSTDFQCRCVGMSPTYAREIMPVESSTWDMKVLFGQRPMSTLDNENATAFCQYYDLLCSKIHLPSEVQSKVIDTLMRAFVYDMMHHLNKVGELPMRRFSSAETLFNRFVQILESTKPRPRHTSYYAERLSITPEYLSKLCKKQSGQSISSIIDQYVFDDMRALLEHSDLSFKEIAAELGFENQSYLGKFVKRRLGISPSELRSRLRSGK